MDSEGSLKAMTTEHIFTLIFKEVDEISYSISEDYQQKLIAFQWTPCRPMLKPLTGTWCSQCRLPRDWSLIWKITYLIYIDFIDDFSSKFAVFSLADCEAMDDFDLPPKKKISIHSEESYSDQLSCGSFFNLSGLKSDLSRFSEIPSSVNHARQGTGSNTKSTLSTIAGSFSNSRSGYPISPPLPTMSKLTMNIGYSKHLATNSAAYDKSHITGEAILEPSQYTSYNLLSNKRLHVPNGNVSDSISILNVLPNDPFSFQQAQKEMRTSLSQPPITDYPLQTPQLNSMYNTTTNSTSITDFKLLMAQTAASDFSNWNDGSIWQPRAISHSSSSTNSLFSEDDSFQVSHDYDENFDEIPSFDEAMDMMMASKL